MNEKLIAFLDKYGLVGSYSGGGDSGGIDDFDTEKENDGSIDMNTLQEWVYEHSLEEYGGWAWNGDASGTIRYSKEEKKIIISGTENSSDDLTEIALVSFKLSDYFSPEDLKRIDSVNIYLSDGEGHNVRVNVLNGPWTESLQKSEEAIVEKMDEIEEKFVDYKFYLDEAVEPEGTVEISIGEIVDEEKYWEIDLTEEEYEEEVTNDK